MIGTGYVSVQRTGRAQTESVDTLIFGEQIRCELFFANTLLSNESLSEQFIQFISIYYISVQTSVSLLFFISFSSKTHKTYNNSMFRQRNGCLKSK